MATVYEKLQTVRFELQQEDIKKTGYNPYSGYKYFELEDILPPITKLSAKHKICSIFLLLDTHAELTVYDAEKPEDYIRFSIKTSEANMKGVLEVQKKGAETTYMRRYMYMTAFEIAENDTVDQGSKKPASKPQKKPSKPVDAELNKVLDEIISVMGEKIASGIDKEALYQIVADNNNGNKNPMQIKEKETAQKILDLVKEVKQ